MASKQLYSAADEQSLMSAIWDPQIADNPLEFVKFVYPWGKPNTPLERHKGPRGWQREQLEEIGLHVKRQRQADKIELSMEMFRYATCSGRGVGKSTEVSWLTHWMMSCNIGSTTIVTANTESQLKSRTWAELGKWITLGINGHWFDKSALSLSPAAWFADVVSDQLKIDMGYYYAQAQLWNEENPDAFAGAHNPHGIMVIMDEASGIPEVIWKVTEGFFTEPELHRYWLAYSNGRKNTGAFFECFHKNRNFWRRRNLDSRDVEGTDKQVLQSIIDQYGEDSDEARVEVKGEFPRQGDKQFIARDLAEGARGRELQEDPAAPLIMGVDVARFGDDSSVIRFRRGRDARSIPAQKFKGLDNMQLAYRIAEAIDKYNPDAVCVDAGNGSGVIDRLREMGYKVHEIWFGSTRTDSPEWHNKRIEMWGRMREWLRGGCFDEDQELVDDLVGPEYKFVANGDAQVLESKEEMKKRGLASPDNGDALALTFAVRVARQDAKVRRGRGGRVAQGVDYDVFGG